MALVLVETPGSASANTNCTLAEAESYFESQLYGTDFTDATEAVQNASLTMATGLFDQLIEWIGTKASDSQALQWPRKYVYDPDGNSVDSTTIPTFLKRATAEFAKWLIAEDRTVESDMKGIKYIQAGTLKLVSDKYDRKTIIPPIVMSMISDYGTKKSNRARKLIATHSPGAGIGSDILSAFENEPINDLLA